MNISRYEFIFGTFLTTLFELPQDESDIKSYSTDLLYQSLIKNLKSGRYYSRCISYGKELVLRDDKNREYHLLLADSYISYYISMAIAERLYWTLPSDQKRYTRYLDKWNKAGGIDSNMPQPSLPYIRTYDDQKKFDLTPEKSKIRRSILRESAFNSFDNALRFASDDISKSRILHERCWAEIISNIANEICKNEIYTSNDKISIPNNFHIDINILSSLEKCRTYDDKNSIFYQSIGDYHFIDQIIDGKLTLDHDSQFISSEYQMSINLNPENSNLKYFLQIHQFLTKNNDSIIDKNHIIEYYSKNAYYWYALAKINKENFLTYFEKGNECNSCSKIEYIPNTLFLSHSFSSLKNIIEYDKIIYRWLISELSSIDDKPLEQKAKISKSVISNIQNRDNILFNKYLLSFQDDEMVVKILSVLINTLNRCIFDFEKSKGNQKSEEEVLLERNNTVKTIKKNYDRNYIYFVDSLTRS